MKQSARKNLVRLRQKRGLTQAEIALNLSIGLRQYQSLEAGTSYGSIRVWIQLKRLLHAKSIDWLLEQSED